MTITMFGEPVELDNSRLAFVNASKGETIHLADPERSIGRENVLEFPFPDTEYVQVGYDWTACGVGASNITPSESYRVSLDELESRYLEIDGDIVGKLCGNCLKSLGITL